MSAFRNSCCVVQALTPLCFGAWLAAQVPAPPAVLAHHGISAATMQSLLVPTATQLDQGLAMAVSVVIDGRPRLLHLRPHDLRAPGCEVLVEDATGLHAVARGPVRTMRGSVDGEVRGAVAANLPPGGGLSAIVLIDDRGFAIEPVGVAGYPTEHIVYPLTDLPVVGAEGREEGAGASTPAAISTRREPLVALLAIEADGAFLAQHAGSVVAAEADMLAVLNGVDLIFQRDAYVMHQVSRIVISNQNYGTTNASQMLANLRTRWNAAPWNAVSRHLVHLFTGVDLDGTTVTTAYTGGVCNANQYGLTQSRYTTHMPYRTAATARSLAVNWNATACSGSTCTIMCPTIGGCSGVVTTLGPAAAQVVAFSETLHGCLHSLVCGWSSSGGDVAFANLDTDPRQEMLLMSIDPAVGTDAFWWGIAWNIDPAGFSTSWSSNSSPGAGNNSEGGGAAFAQLDGDPRPDLVLMVYDAPSGSNYFKYKVLRNLDSAGQPSAVGPWKVIGGVGDLGDGAGITFVQINNDPRPDMILMAYDDPTGANDIRYRVAFDLDAVGNTANVTAPIGATGFGDDAEGAGVAAGFFNANTQIDLLVMAYDIGSPANDIRYRFLYDIRPDGSFTSMSGQMGLAGHGQVGEGAGVAVADLDGNGRAEALFAVIDAPPGVNQYRWTTVGDLGVLRGRFGAFGASCRPGMSHYVTAPMGVPFLGQPIDLQLVGAPAIRSAFGTIGMSRSQLPPYALPLDLAVIGAPGCLAYTDFWFTLTTVTSPFGAATTRWIVPRNPSIVGLEIYTQYYVQDLPANPAGVISSNAGLVVIGG